MSNMIPLTCSTPFAFLIRSCDINIITKAKISPHTKTQRNKRENSVWAEEDVALTTAPVTSIYISVGASFCKIISSFGGMYSAFISETFKIKNKIRKNESFTMEIPCVKNFRSRCMIKLPVGRVSRLILRGTSRHCRQASRRESERY